MRTELSMDRNSLSSISLQRKLAATKNNNNHHKPDLTDFMNDMFFGTINTGDSKKSYNLTGDERRRTRDGDRDHLDEFDSSTRSVSSRQTQEWLEKAKQMVASSPSRGSDSPARLVGSPRFGVTQGRLSTSSLDKRDPLSRSARRHRALESYSGEILSRTSILARNRSDTKLDLPSAESSPASDVHKWLSNIPKPNSEPTISPESTPPSPTSLPPRQSVLRKSRFQNDPTAPSPHPIPTPTALPSNFKRHFKIQSPSHNLWTTNTILDNNLLSPPKNIVQSANRRSISSSTCSVRMAEALSPPRNLVDSSHRRSVSQSTCRSDSKLRRDIIVDDGIFEDGEMKVRDLNGFLKNQRVKIGKIFDGEIDGKAKVVLSGPSNSTSSMVAAICHAWLFENTTRASNGNGGRGKGDDSEFVVPVMNIRRGKMWRQRQAAWLFHHANLDANALLFSNEVDLESLMMAKKVSILVVGEDILGTSGEVGSPCTILTDNYCEDAYDLLQNPVLKKLMLAGILLDTHNLNTSQKLPMARDAEAVQLLSVGSSPDYRNTLFNQLMQDQRDSDFFEVLRRTYGKSPGESSRESREPTGRKTPGKNSSNGVTAPSENKPQNGTTVEAKAKKILPSPGKLAAPPMRPPEKAPAKPVEPPREKNKNFFAKLFGFSSKS